MAAATPDDLDLSGLDVRAARGFVLRYATSLKEAARRRSALAADLQAWTDRAALARERGRADLAAAAEARVAALQPELAAAGTDEATLSAQVATLKERLKLKMHGEIERSVDSERLEAELEMLVGEEGAVDSKLRSAQAASELDELRKRLRGG